MQQQNAREIAKCSQFTIVLRCRLYCAITNFIRWLHLTYCVQADLRVLTELERLLIAPPSAAVDQQQSDASHPSRASSSASDTSPDQQLSGTLQSGGEAEAAPLSDTQMLDLLYEQDTGRSAFGQAELDEQTQALQGIWQQLIAQQRLNGHLPADNSSQGHPSETQSIASSQDSAAEPQEEPPFTPSAPFPSTSDADGLLHPTLRNGTGMLNPLWSPDSPAGSVNSPNTPQVNAAQNSGWYADAAEVQEHTTSSEQHAVNGFHHAQPAAHFSPEGPLHWPGWDAEHSEAASSPVQQPDYDAHSDQALHQTASTSTDRSKDAPHNASTDIYAAAQMRLNKDAAQAFFVKGEEAVQKHDWAKAVRDYSTAANSIIYRDNCCSNLAI